MSQLRQHYDALTGAGWAIYGVTPGRPDAVADYTRQEQIRFPVLIDADRAVSKLYGVFTPFSHDGFNMPTVNMPHNSTVLIDSSGQIRYLHVGARSTDLPDESALLAAMAQIG